MSMLKTLSLLLAGLWLLSLILRVGGELVHLFLVMALLAFAIDLRQPGGRRKGASNGAG